ncbi:MAG: hypothetical protein GY761_17615 [Hyphomicrobiales bacterium]|nr:hypothetical protein [Hyphomicrobiales bacterium]
MNIQVLFSVVFLLLTEHFSWAGHPIEETKVCPVGGEKFNVTGTLSCTTAGQIRTMSMRPATSCEFVTRLPVCPENGLPVYQEFTQEQVAKLEIFLKTPQFQNLKSLPPWQRAYGVSQHLGESGTAIAFHLLNGALWYEGEEFLKSERAVDRFLIEAKSEVGRASERDKPFLQAIIAYVLVTSKRPNEAEVWLKKVSQSVEGSDYLKQYLSAIRACQNDIDREGCGPLDNFDYVKPSLPPIE